MKYLPSCSSSFASDGYIYMLGHVSVPESQSVEDCGERTKRILESPSVPQANHQLLAHVTRHLARVAVAQSGQHGQASPRLLGQAFSGFLFKPALFRYWIAHNRPLMHRRVGMCVSFFKLPLNPSLNEHKIRSNLIDPEGN